MAPPPGPEDASSRAEEVLDRVNGLIGRPGKAADAEPEPAEAPADVVDAEVVEPAPQPAPVPANPRRTRPTHRARGEPAHPAHRIRGAGAR
ncbi:hypothetical protein [Nocardia sp. CA-290969]|uniref:hypothetical protein n=1 Tax=Nocardia sp. CA-290969 TaxID=3239986 RepID=UPI003D931C22